MTKNIISASFVFLFACLLMTIGAKTFAQEAQITDFEPEWSNEEKASPTGVDCFDYYKFQSVQVSLGTQKDLYKPGEKIEFKGELINENEYPIFDGNVFVRISRDNENFLEEGHFIVDEFIALEQVALDQKEKKQIEFDWQVPARLKGGKYHADFFFSVGKKFNLGGLPFTNEVIIGKAEFSVQQSSEVAGVSFDRAGTKVNGQPYKQIGAWPIVELGGETEITQVLKNNSAQEKTADLHFELFYWDSLDEQDKLDNKTETIDLEANSSKELSYLVPDVAETVYYLKITAEDVGQKSIINVRIAADGQRPRLNFPAITKFPLKKGDKFNLFSCFHNTSGVDTSGQATVKIIDKDNQTIGELNYQGEIYSDMIADRKELIAAKDYNELTLLAKVYDHQDKLVDSYKVEYNCQLIGNCPTAKQDISQKLQITDKTHLKFGVAMIVLGLLLGVAAFLGLRKMRKNE